MGLDLCIVAFDKDCFNKYGDFIYDIDDPELADKNTELWYGRKTWSIVDFFCDRIEESDAPFNNNCDRVLDREVLDEFYDTVEPYQYILERVHYYPKYDDSWTVALQREYASQLYIWEAIVKRIGRSCVLGADWECAAYLRLINAKEDIYKAFDEGKVVCMIASY